MADAASTGGAPNAAGVEVRANLTVFDAPFETTTVDLHLHTDSGVVMFDNGHLDDADFKVEMPYSLAYEIFVARDPAAVMPVLLGGQVKLSGDASKLLMLADMVLAADTVLADPEVADTELASGSAGSAADLGARARRLTAQIDSITTKE